MTYEAEIAKQVGYQFECKKDRLSQNQDGGVKVTFNIQPNDVPTELFKDAMGQRYMAVLVPLNDDETPRQQSKKNYTAAAKLLTKNPDFHRFAREIDPDRWFIVGIQWDEPDEVTANHFIYSKCGVSSCSEIKDGTEAGKEFTRLYAEFMDWQGIDARHSDG